jgi:hypothetical protein
VGNLVIFHAPDTASIDVITQTLLALFIRSSGGGKAHAYSQSSSQPDADT